MTAHETTTAPGSTGPYIGPDSGTNTGTDTGMNTSTNKDTNTNTDTGTAPVACALTSAGLAAQAGRWERLAGRAAADRTQTEHGLRIRFRREPGAEEELRALVAVENECCSWATWTVETGPAHIVLDVRSAGAGVAVLHDMFTGLRPSPAS